MSDERELDYDVTVDPDSRFKLIKDAYEDGTYWYQIFDKQNDIVVLEGDGFETEEEMLKSLFELAEAFKGIFG